MKPEELQDRMYPKKQVTPEPKVEEKEPPETPEQEQTEMEQENPHPINLLAARVFAARNASHRAHWAAKGAGAYAEHIALGEFYDAIVEAIDTVIEVDQGLYGLIGDFTVEDVKPTDMASYIRAEAKWIELNRDKFSKCMATLALIDDLTAIYLRTAYKLTNLK